MNLFDTFNSESDPKDIARAMLREPMHPGLCKQVRRALKWIGRNPSSVAAGNLVEWADGESLIHCLDTASRSSSFADWVSDGDLAVEEYNRATDENSVAAGLREEYMVRDGRAGLVLADWLEENGFSRASALIRRNTTVLATE